MYKLISALAEPLNGNSRWAAAEIGSLSMLTIYTRYAHVRAVLSNNFLDHPVSLDLALMRGQWGDSILTFNQLLANLGSASLPTVDEIPVLKPSYARYADAIRSGYKARLIHPTFAADAYLPRSELTWLSLTRPNTDYALFHRYCLVSVNGYYHPTDFDVNRIYVKEAGRSLALANENTVGVLSFGSLGTITQIPITPQMVGHQGESEAFRHRATVNVGMDITNKTVLLVLGGYLHVYDAKTFYRTGDQTLAIDFQNLPLYERYLESRRAIDLSTLPVSIGRYNDSHVGAADFYSDANLLAYMTLPQSFLVVLDAANIFVNRLPVKAAPMPGMYTSYVRPDYPLVNGFGRVANYWSTKEDGQWSLNCVNGLKSRSLLDTVDRNVAVALTDARIPTLAEEFSAAHLLQIGKDLS